MAIAAVVLMVRLASVEQQSMVAWGFLTAGACAAAVFLLPWPFLRIALAAVACFLAMTAYKIIARK